MGRKVGPGLAAACALALAGCKDLGVRGSANVPLAIARTRPAAFWSYQAVLPQQRQGYEGHQGELLTVGSQKFLVQFPDFAGPPSLLAPVAAQGGAGVYALRGTQAPFGEVYVAAGPGRLQVAPEVWR